MANTSVVDDTLASEDALVVAVTEGITDGVLELLDDGNTVAMSLGSLDDRSVTSDAASRTRGATVSRSDRTVLMACGKSAHIPLAVNSSTTGSILANRSTYRGHQAILGVREQQS